MLDHYRPHDGARAERTPAKQGRLPVELRTVDSPGGLGCQQRLQLGYHFAIVFFRVNKPQKQIVER